MGRPRDARAPSNDPQFPIRSTHHDEHTLLQHPDEHQPFAQTPFGGQIPFRTPSADPVRSEPVRPEPVWPGPLRSGSPRTDPVRPEHPRPDPLRSGPLRQTPFGQFPINQTWNQTTGAQSPFNQNPSDWNTVVNQILGAVLGAQNIPGTTPLGALGGVNPLAGIPGFGAVNNPFANTFGVPFAGAFNTPFAGFNPFLAPFGGAWNNTNATENAQSEYQNAPCAFNPYAGFTPNQTPANQAA